MLKLLLFSGWIGATNLRARFPSKPNKTSEVKEALNQDDDAAASCSKVPVSLKTTAAALSITPKQRPTGSSNSIAPALRESIASSSKNNTSATQKTCVSTRPKIATAVTKKSIGASVSPASVCAPKKTTAVAATSSKALALRNNTAPSPATALSSQKRTGAAPALQKIIALPKTTVVAASSSTALALRNSKAASPATALASQKRTAAAAAAALQKIIAATDSPATALVLKNRTASSASSAIILSASSPRKSNALSTSDAKALKKSVIASTSTALALRKSAAALNISTKPKGSLSRKLQNLVEQQDFSPPKRFQLPITEDSENEMVVVKRQNVSSLGGKPKPVREHLGGKNMQLGGNLFLLNLLKF